MDQERLYQVALTMVPNIGYVHAKSLIEKLGSATDVFKASPAILTAIEGIGEVRAKAFRQFRDFRSCENILRDVERYQLSMVFINEESYPPRLAEIYDPPALLYYTGTLDLNKKRVVAVIGTRNHSEYGRQLTEKFIRELQGHEITIISGMAYGIDGIAHRSALKYNFPTIGVLAHGLDRIYPPEHSALAREMLMANGALLTEFITGTQPDRHHFPIRNRVVAGICDAIIVVETGIRGGSISTASLAFSYNRPVFAFPGKVADTRSAGCNGLIQNRKADLITDAGFFLDQMMWNRPEKEKSSPNQMSFFQDLDQASASIISLLGIHGELPLNELYLKSGLNSGIAASVLLDLELKKIIRSRPGNRYSLV